MLVAMLTTLAAAVLLVACGNVTGLLTSGHRSGAGDGAAARHRRGRGRLIRQLVTEISSSPSPRALGLASATPG